MATLGESLLAFAVALPVTIVIVWRVRVLQRRAKQQAIELAKRRGVEDAGADSGPVSGLF